MKVKDRPHYKYKFLKTVQDKEIIKQRKLLNDE